MAASPTVSARAEAVRSGVKSHPAAAAPPRDISEEADEWSCIVEGGNCRFVIDVLGVRRAWMCKTGERMVVADSSVAIIRAMRFLGDAVVVDIIVVVVVDSRGLFRTLLR
mmetsp:Transcript_21391/g.32029  ORF Transcript_21391/g.32029 Transcript_21391/m.32029 type:complete len:110 (-) Transcript_21391:215-544(-)